MHVSHLPARWLPCAVVLLLPALPSAAAVFAVGPGPGCTHTTIQAAINAAEANPGDDFIRIPHSQVWNGQALVINTNQALWLEGFWSDCNTIDGSLRTTLDGAGGSAAPVLRIEAGTGSFISLDSLTIRNGDVAGNGGKGGGVYYRGNGSLAIANSAIINNTAGLGGGMYLEGTGSAATVQIFANVAINGNIARDSGGGVFAEGVNFYMLQPNSIIAFNTATGYSFQGSTLGGYGGGLVVNSSSGLHGYATIAGAGVGNAGAIYANTARYGGGVSVLGESGINAGATLTMYTIDPQRPTAIRDNFASVAGGGLHLQPRVTFFTISSAYAWLSNAVIDLNAAPDGAAIYLGESTTADNITHGGYLQWNYGTPPAGAAPCPANAPCGRIAGNVALDGTGTPTIGAVVNMRENSTFRTSGSTSSGDPTRGIIIEGNRGGRLFDIEGGEDRVFLSLRSSLIVDNELSQELVRARDEPQVALIDSTLAGNSIGAGHVFAVSDELIVQRSIIWQPGKTSQVGPMPAVEWSFASEVASLGGGPGAILVNPRFVDPVRGDYRLRAASQAIDWVPPVVGDDRDVHGLPRDQRIGFLPRLDASRVRDVGAHERQVLLPLVLNGEFAGDTNLWALPVGHAGAYQVTNAPGSTAGTGAAQVVGTSTTGRLLGYAQCLHLPGPGLYTLNGTGRSTANPQLSNPTALIWELRASGGEDCSVGAITAGGTHTLSTQQTTDQWIRPASPAMISVPAAMWNHTTSLTVIMAVYPNASNNNAYTGQFDAIRLEPASDLIFANGFQP